MERVGSVESLWRYPVKSMRGEQQQSAFASFAGMRGDRIYALHDTAAPADFPYLTARQQARMLLFGPRPQSADSRELSIECPDGQVFSIDDAALLRVLVERLDERHHLSVIRSERALTDAHPVSLFSIQTARQLAEDLRVAVDKRRFRANIYLDLDAGGGFGEDQFVGHCLRIGSQVVLAVLERDPRCKIVTLDPDTTAANPEVIKRLARDHQTRAGIYAAVLAEGRVQQGDEVYLLP
jgi:uncharacterized protein YcbX